MTKYIYIKTQEATKEVKQNLGIDIEVYLVAIEGTEYNDHDIECMLMHDEQDIHELYRQCLEGYSEASEVSFWCVTALDMVEINEMM